MVTAIFILVFLILGIEVAGFLIADDKRKRDFAHLCMIIDDVNRQVAFLGTVKASSMTHPVQKPEPEKEKGDRVHSKRAFVPIARLRSMAAQEASEERDKAQRRITANTRALEG